MKSFGLSLLRLAVLLLSVPFWSAAADVPQVINFQGRLTDTNNNPESGSINFVFRLYDAVSGGTQLPAGSAWSEPQTLSVVNGVFNAQIGSAVAIPYSVFSSSPVFLEITVGGETLSPREPLFSAPFAVNAHMLSGRTYDAFIDTVTAQSIDGVKTFSSFPVKSGSLTPGAPGEFTTKNYVDGLFAGNSVLNSTNTWTAPQTFNSSITVNNAATLGAAGQAVQISSNAYLAMLSGLVGIGTSSPEALLDISGDGASVLVPRKSTAGDPATGVNGMIYYNSNSNKFRGYQNGVWNDMVTNAATDIIQNQETLQTGATFYVSSGSVQNNFYVYGTINGNGSGITNLNASNLVSGTVPVGQLPATVMYTDTDQTVTGVKTLTSSLTVTNADGTQVTYGVRAGSLTLTADAALSINGSVGSSGQILQSNGAGTAPTWIDPASASALLNSTNTWTAQQTFQNPLISLSSLTVTAPMGVGVTYGVVAGSFTGNGAGLTNLTPGNISAGLAGIDISGNAATATHAVNATTAGNLAGGATTFIQLRETLQAGSTFYTSSGTVNNLNIQSTLQVAGAAGNSGQILQSNGAGAAPTWIDPASASALLNSTNTWTAQQTYQNLVTVSTSLIVNNGNVQINPLSASMFVKTDANKNLVSGSFALTDIPGGATSYIQARDTLQSGATFYTSSGTVNALTVGNSITLPIQSVALNSLVYGTLPSGVVASSIAYGVVYPGAVQNGIYPNITGVGSQSQSLSMNSHQINNMLDPTGPADGATKNYVDVLVYGNTNYIHVTNTLQSGSTFYVSSGTINNLNIQNTLRLSGAAGNSGQILQSNGAGTVPTWVDPASASALLNSTNTWTASQTYQNPTTMISSLTVANAALLGATGQAVSISSNAYLAMIGGLVGVGTANPEALLDIRGDGASVLVPRKSTPGDPATGVNGMIYYNSSTNRFRGYQNNAWGDMVTNAATDVILEQDTLQSGATFYVSSGTVLNNFYVYGTINGNGSGITNLNPANISAGTAGISITGNAATADYATAAGSAGSIVGGATTYIQVRETLQSGATFYTSSGTVNSLNVQTSVQFAGASGGSGQILQSNGAGVAPTWVDPASASALLNSTNTWTASQTYQNPTTMISSLTVANAALLGATGQAVSVSSNAYLAMLGGLVGVGTAAPEALLDIRGDGASVLVPRKSTGGDPATGVNGMIYYNSSTNRFRGYQNNAWGDMVTNAATDVILEQDTLQSGATFYVSSGSVLNNFYVYGTINGNGSGITNLNASNLVSGTVPIAQLPTTVMYTDTIQNISGNKTFGSSITVTNAGGVGVTYGVIAGSFTGIGSGLTALTPGNISAGTAGIDITGNAATATHANGATTAGSLAGGATTYIQLRDTLQSGATFFVSSGTVAGDLTVGSNVNVRGLNYGWPSAHAVGVLSNNGAGSLTWAPAGAGAYILNTNTLQAGSTAFPEYLYVGSSASVMGAGGLNVNYGLTAGSFTLNGPFVASGSAGSIGYSLQSNGPGSAPSWVAVAGVGSLLNSTNTWTAGQTFISSITISSTVVAGNGAGIVGQVLQSNGAGAAPTWVAPGSVNTLLNSTNTWTAQQTYENQVTVSSHLVINNGNVQINPLSASQFVKTDANKNLVSSSISSPDLPATVMYTDTTQNVSGNKTFSSSITVTNAGGVNVTYGVVAGSFTGNGSGLTNLTPGNISAGTAGIDISGNAATATYATTAGSAGTLVGGATTYIQVRDTLQSGATFYTSSGTVVSLNVQTNMQFNGTAGGSGQILQSNGAGAAPTWVNPASASALLNSTNTWTASQTYQQPTTMISSLTVNSAALLGAAGQAVTISSNVTLGGATSLTNIPSLNASQFVKSDANKNLVSGTISGTDLPANVVYTDTIQNISGNKTFSSSITVTNSGGVNVTYGVVAGSFTGIGTGLTSLTGANIASGIPSSVLPSTVAYTNTAQTWTAAQTFNNPTTMVSSLTVNSAALLGAANQAVTISSNLVVSGALIGSNNSGTSGQILQSNGAGTAPSWINPASASALLNSTNTWTAQQTFQNQVTVSSHLVINNGNVQLNPLSASQFVKTDASKNLVSATISGTDLPANVVYTDTIQNISGNKTFSSSITVTNSGGVNVTYGVVAGSLTANDLTASQFVKTDGNKKLVSATLASTDIVGGATSYIQLRDTLQAFATYYVSSGTVVSLNVQTNMQFNGTAGGSGQILQSNGAGAAPTWVNPASASALLNSTNTWTASQTYQQPTTMISSLTVNSAALLGAAGQAVTISSNVTLGGATSLTNVPALNASQFVKSDANKNLVSGTISGADLPANVVYTDTIQNISGNKTFSSSITVTNAGGVNVTYGVVAGSFTGIGTGLTALTGANIASGIPSSVLPSTVAYTNTAQTWTAAQTFNSPSTMVSSLTVNSAALLGAANQAVTISSNLVVSGAVLASNNSGTSGQLLQSNGAGTAPTWVNPASASVLLNSTNTWTAQQTFQNQVTVSSHLVVNSGNVQLNPLTASMLVKTDANKNLVSGTLATTDIPGGVTSYIQLRDTLQSGATFYVSSGSVLNNFDVGGNLGVGDRTPTEAIDVEKTQDAASALRIYNGDGGGSAQSQVRLQNSAGTFSMSLNGSGRASNGGLSAMQLWLALDAPMLFYTNNTERMRISNTGGLIVAGPTISTFTYGVAVGSLAVTGNTPLSINGSIGSSGQILQSNGAGSAPTWVAPAAASALLNSTNTWTASQTYQQPTTMISSLTVNSAALLGAAGQAVTISSNVVLGGATSLTNVPALNASQFVKSDANKNLVSGTISGTDLPANVVYTDTIQNISGNKTFSSSITVTNAGGVNVTYGVVAGSLTANDLTASQFVKTDGNKKLVSATLTSTDIVGGATSYIQLRDTLQAFATYYVSSGTVVSLNVQTNMQFNGTAGGSGQILQSNGAGAAPTWVNPASASALLNSTNTWTASQTYQQPTTMISSLTVNSAAFLGAAGQAVTISSNVTLGGATSLTNIPSLNASQFVKSDANKNLVSGTISGADLPANVVYTDTIQNISGNKTFSSSITVTNSGGVNVTYGVVAGSFTGVGSGLTALTPGNISAGTAGISITGNAATADYATVAGSAVTLVGGATTYIQLRDTLQAGATYFVSSGTVNNLNIQSTLQLAGAPGSSGQLLQSNGVGTVPTWVNPASASALLNSTNTWTGGQTYISSVTFSSSVVVNSASISINNGQFGSTIKQNGNSGSGTVTIDWSTGNTQHVVLNGTPTFAFTNGVSGRKYVLILKQDGTGSRTVSWPGTARFPGGVNPVLSAGINKSDYIAFVYNDVDTSYDNLAVTLNY